MIGVCSVCGGGALPTTIDGWRAYLATLPLDDFPALKDRLMRDTEKKLVIDLQCSCGGKLWIEYPLGHSVVRELIDLAAAWTDAHKPHHEEPNKGAAPEPATVEACP